LGRHGLDLGAKKFCHISNFISVYYYWVLSGYTEAYVLEKAFAIILIQVCLPEPTSSAAMTNASICSWQKWEFSGFRGCRNGGPGIPLHLPLVKYTLRASTEAVAYGS
jgi:hypothetical protein